jgi:hypothetical protein
MLAPLDLVAEYCWDSITDLQFACAHHADTLFHGHDKVTDPENRAAFATTEHLIFDHSDGGALGRNAIKILFLLTRKHGLSLADTQATWLRDHAPIAAASADVSFLTRYVQSHAIAGDENERLQQLGGCGATFDGMTEPWLNSPDDLKRGVETEAGRAAAGALLRDERRFVQLDKSRCFVTREHVVFETTV